MTFRLAARENNCEGDTLLERFEFAKEMGFDGLELPGKGGGVFLQRVDEIRAARAAGAEIPSAVANVEVFMGAFDPVQRRGAIDELKAMLDVIAASGMKGIVAPHAFGQFSKKLPPFEPPRSDEDSRALLLEALREVSAHAATLGVAVWLEPLNRFEDFVVNTLADAAWYVDQIDSPGLGITADTWHMSIEEANIGDAIRAAGSRIRHVQLGDSNRLEPGAGHYDWDETLTALEDIGYDGWLAMECGLSGPPREVLPRVAALLKR